MSETFRPGNKAPQTANYTLHKGIRQVCLVEVLEDGTAGPAIPLKLPLDEGERFPPGPYPGFTWRVDKTQGA